MRPKKRILLIDADEDEISTLRLVLITRGYRVLYASSAKTASAELPEVDLVLAVYAMPQNADKVIRALKLISPHTPMIILSDLSKMNGIHSADGLLDRKTCAPIELLERVKIMVQRRPGPRKGAQRAIPESVEAVTA